MKYDNIKQGIFLCRPNRFIAHVEIGGKTELVHVKNTGRCKELLIEGVTVFVQEFDKSTRKTKFDLIAVQKGDILINIDSQVPNKVVGEWLLTSSLLGNITLIKPETTYGNSRFDFYIEADDKKIFAEVKGVTLEQDGVVLFPDAPTLRGVKHIKELCRSMQEGYQAYMIFLVQLQGAKYFTPNIRTQPEFGKVLKCAERQGVHIIVLDCVITRDSITANSLLPIKL